MTDAQRHITIAISVIVGLTLLVIAGLTFLVQPLTQDLALSDQSAEQALVAPTIASLLVVFIAGRAGDRFGQRRTIVVAAAVFTIGAAVLATAQAENGVIIGLALCGAGAIIIQVVALSLLQRTAPDGEAHTAAFTTFGAVFPIAFLIFPIATAYLLSLVDWRWVPVLWAVAGVVVIVVSMVVLDRDEAQGSIGEWASPILAGIALTAGTRVLDELGATPSDGRLLKFGGAVFVVAISALIMVTKRAVNPSFPSCPQWCSPSLGSGRSAGACFAHCQSRRVTAWRSPPCLTSMPGTESGQSLRSTLVGAHTDTRTFMISAPWP